MDKKIKRQTFLLGFVVLVSVALLMSSLGYESVIWQPEFTKKQVQLGEDLQGGVRIVYDIDLDRALLDKAADIKRGLEAEIAEKADDEVKKAAKSFLIPTVLGGVALEIAADGWDTAKIRGKYLDSVKDTTTVDCPEPAANRACIRVTTDFAYKIKAAALEQSKQIIKDRIDARGVAQPTVVSKGDQILVILPGLAAESIEQTRSEIEKTARLEFRIVDVQPGTKPTAENNFIKRVAGHINTQTTGKGRDKTRVASEALAKSLGVVAESEIWNTDDNSKRFEGVYLTAEASTIKGLTYQDAKARGWYRSTKCREDDGLYDCEVDGDMKLRYYLKDLSQKCAAQDASLPAGSAALCKDDPTYFGTVIEGEFSPDPDHDILFEKDSVYVKDEKKVFWRSYFLKSTVELTGSAIDRAFSRGDQFGKLGVIAEFDRWGTTRFCKMTTAHVGQKMAIILDNKVESAPTIAVKICDGSTRITLGGESAQDTKNRVEYLVRVLRSGSLVAPLREQSMAQLGPTLGTDAINKTQFSFILGSALVVVIMVWVYRFAGIISILALVLNLTLMMAVLAMFGAILTLPGIAALVLTVGMAVDANIIIYERIREELRLGKSVRGAVDAGFSRGFAAIFDGQITTLVAGYVLYQYGSGPIKGFAVMLMIGIICTLFTAYWCTKLFFEYYIGRGRKAQAISI